jgi:ubiquinone/menaquinone biosynthesis C-methylase UbiE
MKCGRTPSFDGLASGYERLERSAFGGLLEAARFGLLEGLTGCRRVLLLGDGDGRLLARLLSLNPEVRIVSVDQSMAMIALAQSRVSAADLPRVTWQQADALVADFGSEKLDAVVTAFFLDCFSTSIAETLMQKISAALTPSALWLQVDFGVPPTGWTRWQAQLWLKTMYAFFRWQTGITARALPELDKTFADLGWKVVQQRQYRQGFVTSRLYRRATC